MPPPGSQEEDDRGDWGGYRRLILNQLSSLQGELGSIRTELKSFREEEMASIKVEIALLKLKSSLWGAALGAASGLLITGGAILLRFVH